MARPTYHARGIVLRKTKLGEMDLIVTFLAPDGAQLRAVAKGARKPGGSLAGKLEIANTVDMLCSAGRSLDTVSEARLSRTHPSFRGDVEKAACAACVAELCEKVTQVELPHKRLFDMVEAAFNALDATQGPTAYYVCAAAMLKTFAFTGITPQFAACAACGSLMRFATERVPFSVAEGGALCDACAQQADRTWPVDAATVQLAASLLMATFDAVAKVDADARMARRVLELCREWSRFHVGGHLRSLDFLLDMDDAMS